MCSPLPQFPVLVNMETINLLHYGPAHHWGIISEFVPFHLWNQEPGDGESAWWACPFATKKADSRSPLSSSTVSCLVLSNSLQPQRL